MHCTCKLCREHKKIGKSWSSHETPPKWEFADYYGIFHLVKLENIFISHKFPCMSIFENFLWLQQFAQWFLILTVIVWWPLQLTAQQSGVNFGSNFSYLGERRLPQGPRKDELATISHKFSFALRPDKGKYHWLKNDVPDIKVDW